MEKHKGDGLYHALVGTKILLALGLFFIASALVGRSAAFESMRASRAKWLKVMVSTGCDYRGHVRFCEGPRTVVKPVANEVAAPVRQRNDSNLPPHPYRRNLMLRYSLCLALLAISSFSLAADPVKPNIVLILADDLGVNDLHCYGRQDHRTPKLDALAAAGRGLRQPIPRSRFVRRRETALMTGKCPARLHLTNYLPGRADAQSQKTASAGYRRPAAIGRTHDSRMAARVGYTTGLFGKWHLGNKGFSRQSRALMWPYRRQPITNRATAKEAKANTRLQLLRKSLSKPIATSPSFVMCRITTHTYRLGAKPELIEQNKDAFHPTYAAMIETLDDAVGRLIRKVDELGLTERTIFISRAINGGLHVSSSQHASHSQYTLSRWQGLCLRRWTARTFDRSLAGCHQAGTTIDTPVVLTDLVPTLLEAPD